MDERNRTTPQPPDLSTEERRVAAQNQMREELLGDLAHDEMSLGDLGQRAKYDYPNDSPDAQQEVVMSVVRSLVEDGLIEVGDGGDMWGLPLEETMHRIHDRYVVHHDDETRWFWTTWFALTEKGQLVADSAEPPT